MYLVCRIKDLQRVTLYFSVVHNGVFVTKSIPMIAAVHIINKHSWAVGTRLLITFIIYIYIYH